MNLTKLYLTNKEAGIKPIYFYKTHFMNDLKDYKKWIDKNKIKFYHTLYPKLAEDLVIDPNDCRFYLDLIRKG